MRGSPTRIALAAALAGWGLAASPIVASAAPVPLVVGPPVPVGPGSGGTLVTGPDGTVTAAWTTVERTGDFFAGPEPAERTTILVADRPPGLPTFTAPQEVAVEEAAVEPSVARGPGGSIAVAWSGAEKRADGVRPPRVAFRLPGTPFTAPVELPLPARLPTAAGNENLIEATRYLSSPRVAIAADGAVGVIACESDRRVSDADGDAIAWVRPPGVAAFPVGRRIGRCQDGASIGADGTGRLTAMWPGAPNGTPPSAPRVIWVAERAPGAPTFGPKQALSDPRVDASDNSRRPELRVNARGDALVVWYGGYLGAAPTRVALRPAGEGWRAAEDVPAPDGVLQTFPALDERGDVAVGYSGFAGVAGRLRPAGGAFGPLTASARPAQSGALAAALDAEGTLIMLRATQGRRELALDLRDRVGTWSGPVPATTPGVKASGGTLATDAYGNGVILWTATANGTDALLASSYSAAPPALTAVSLTTRTLRLRAAEPARLALTATAGRRSAKQTTAALPAGRTATIPLSASVRRVLAVRGAQLTVRARDGGPTVTTKRLRPSRSGLKTRSRTTD